MKKMHIKNRYVRYGLLALLGLVIIILIGITWWGLTPLGPSAEALAATKSSSTVEVSHIDGVWLFQPKNQSTGLGYIFYPGGHVDARSYAIYATEIAEKGYLVAIPEMPLSLAVLGPNRANEVMKKYSDIKKWSIGGHSLGGAMAASYTSENTNKLQGLVLLAAYAPNGKDISQTNISVASLVGTQDTVINRSSLDAGRNLLPKGTQYLDLEGGNHAQFGSYGNQPGDTADPTMSAAEQRRRSVEASLLILSK